MRSESLFVACKKCKTQIRKDAGMCPHCGSHNKYLTPLQTVGGLVAGLLVIGFVFSSGDGDSTASQSRSRVTEQVIPAEQAAFVEVVTRHAALYKNAKNELQQSALRDKRKRELEQVLLNHSVDSWIGTVSNLETTSDGKAILSVRLAPNVTLKTWNNALSDIGSKTLIEKQSNVYATLFKMSHGVKIQFSGQFLASDKDFFEEASLTIDGSMKDPEFLFRFNVVSPIY